MTELTRSGKGGLLALAAVLSVVICAVTSMAAAGVSGATGADILDIPSPSTELTSGMSVHDGEHYYVRGEIEMGVNGWEDETYHIYLAQGSSIQLMDGLRGTWIVHLAADGDAQNAPSRYYGSLRLTASDGALYEARADGPCIEGSGAEDRSCGMYVSSSSFGTRWYPDGADAGKVDLTPKFSMVSMTNGSCIAEGYLCSVQLEDIVSHDPVTVTTPRWLDESDNTDMFVSGGNCERMVFVPDQEDGYDDDHDDDDDETEKPGTWVLDYPATSGRITMLTGYCSLSSCLYSIASGVSMYDGDSDLWTSFEFAASRGFHTVSLRGGITLEGRTVPYGMAVLLDSESIGDVVVDGALRSSGKLTIGSLKGTGTVSADGGTELGDAVFDDGMAFNGDLECRSMTINGGTVTVNGSLSCGDVVISKDCKLIVTGDAATGAMTINGGAEVSGSLSTGDLTITGSANVVGDLASEDVVIDGTLTVAGVMSSKNIDVSDRVKVVSEGTLYILDVRGRLDVYKDLIYERTRARGDVAVRGSVLFGDIEARQSFAVEGEVAAGDFVIEDGAIVKIKGNMVSEDLTVAEGGELTVEGDLKCSEPESLGAETSFAIKAMGTIKIKSNLEYDEASVFGSLDVGGDLKMKSIKVYGGLDVEGEVVADCIVAGDGHDIDGAIRAEMLVVPSAASFTAGSGLEVGDLVVLGTFSSDASFSAERIFVGLAGTSDSPSLGDAAALLVPEGTAIDGLKAMYIAEGAVVEGVPCEMVKTVYLVNGNVYATALSPIGSSLKVSDLRVPALNGTSTSGWMCTVDGKEAAVGDMLVGAADEVHAALCSVSVEIGEGFSKVFVDGTEVPMGEEFSLAVGEHTVTWALDDGYADDGAVASFAGSAVSGGSFTVDEGDGGAVLSLTGAKPVNDEGGSSWTACAAVLIIMVVLAAALIGHRALRP